MDTVVFRLRGINQSDPLCAAYQVEAIVGGRQKLITRKGTRWQSRAVVFLQPSDSISDSGLSSKSDAMVESTGKNGTKEKDRGISERKGS
jgi:hypothetical protein